MQDLDSQKNAQLFWLPGVFLFIALILIDQVSKYFAKNIFRNYAFAFSLPVPSSFIYLIYAVVLGGMIYYVLKNNKNFSVFVKIAWTFIFAGALSNISERILLGFVRDFVYISFYKWTGIYNLADGYIILGIVIILFNQSKNSKLQIPNIK
jgi:signal peptidase II